MRGQNFLIDGNILSRLSDITLGNSIDSIIEIGAGLGNWTEHLARRGGKVYAFEVDDKFYPILCQRMASYPNVEPVHADVLKYDFHRFFRRHPGERFVIAGNLPYRVASPILFQWIRYYRETEGRSFDRACFMLQKEVAQRMTAQPGRPEYGRLTVMLAYYGRVCLERVVPRQCFFPAPRVDSAFVSVAFGAGVRERPEEDARFEEVVRLAFGQRRKQLRNALGDYGRKEAPRGLSGEAAFAQAGIDGSSRAGAVSAEAFLRLVRSLGEGNRLSVSQAARRKVFPD